MRECKTRNKRRSPSTRPLGIARQVSPLAVNAGLENRFGLGLVVIAIPVLLVLLGLELSQPAKSPLMRLLSFLRALL